MFRQTPIHKSRTGRGPNKYICDPYRSKEEIFYELHSPALHKFRKVLGPLGGGVRVQPTRAIAINESANTMILRDHPSFS